MTPPGRELEDAAGLEPSAERVSKAPRGQESALARAWDESPQPPPLAGLRAERRPFGAADADAEAELEAGAPEAERRESRLLEENVLSLVDKLTAVLERAHLESEQDGADDPVARAAAAAAAAAAAPDPALALSPDESDRAGEGEGEGEGAEGPGPYTRQPVPAPYLLESPAEGVALVIGVEAAAGALSAHPGGPDSAGSSSFGNDGSGAGRAALAGGLARALSDARLLGTALLSTIPGRQRFRAMLAALRAAGRPRLAAGVIAALVAALQQPPLREWTAGDAEAMVDHCTALLLAGTTEAPRTAPDLFALSWEQAQRLVGRVQLLGGEFPAVRPKALFFCAAALDRYDKVQEATGLYFEAWAELVRRQMAPGLLEALLIPALADIHFAQGLGRMGLHIADKAYFMEGDSPEALYSQYLVLHVRMIACRWRNDCEGALAASFKALEVVERLGGASGYALPLCRMLQCHALNCVIAGRFRGRPGLQATLRALHILKDLQDPSLCELDFYPDHVAGGLGRQRIELRDRARNLAVLARVIAHADKKVATPLMGHIHFRRGAAYHDLGDTKHAREQYEAALRVYRKLFPDYFPEDCPRVLVIRRALAELDGPCTPPRRYAPLSSLYPSRSGFLEQGSEADAGAGAVQAPAARTTGILWRLLGRDRSPRVAPAQQAPPVWA